jgi:hypothetical protein
MNREAVKLLAMAETNAGQSEQETKESEDIEDV